MNCTNSDFKYIYENNMYFIILIRIAPINIVVICIAPIQIYKALYDFRSCNAQ